MALEQIKLARQPFSRRQSGIPFYFPCGVLAGDSSRASESPAAGLEMQQDGHRSPRNRRRERLSEYICYRKDANVLKRRTNCEIILSCKNSNTDVHSEDRKNVNLFRN